jgi:hypothetical protein
MKQAIISLVLAVLLFLATLWFVGCVQIIKEPDRLQINTFLKAVEFDRIVYDENDLTIENYTGLPSNVELVYDPLTHTFKFIAKK